LEHLLDGSITNVGLEFSEEIEKMIFSFGFFEKISDDLISVFEHFSFLFVKNVLLNMSEFALRMSLIGAKKSGSGNFEAKKKMQLNHLLYAINSPARQSRIRDVVLFLRKNKTVEKTVATIEKEDFHEESIVDGMGEAPEEEDKILVESFWDMMSDETKSLSNNRKTDRLKYRSDISSTIGGEQYENFSKNTKVSYGRTTQRRKKFCDRCNLKFYPIELNKEGIDVLAQLAYDHLEDFVRGMLSKKIEFTKSAMINYVKAMIPIITEKRNKIENSLDEIDNSFLENSSKKRKKSSGGDSTKTKKPRKSKKKGKEK